MWALETNSLPNFILKNFEIFLRNRKEVAESFRVLFLEFFKKFIRSVMYYVIKYGLLAIINKGDNIHKSEFQ